MGRLLGRSSSEASAHAGRGNPGWSLRSPTLAEQEGRAAGGANAHDKNGPSQPGKEADAIGGREAHQTEKVEGNHDQDAEQDRNQHDRGCNSLHAATLLSRRAPG
jgi:hypothetical protein